MFEFIANDKNKKEENKKDVIDVDTLINDIKNNTELFIPNWNNIDHWIEKEFKDILTKIWGYIHFKSNNLNENFKVLLIISALYTTKHFMNGSIDYPKPYKSKLRMKEIEEKKKKI